MKVLLTGIVLLFCIGSIQAQKISASDSALLASMPPLPALDTTAVPTDDLTTEIRKLLTRTNIMTAALQGLKGIMDVQRNANPQIPKEFYTRFNQQLESGRIGRLFENMLIRIYRDRFNVVEIREINKFYDTPVGKKLASETTNIMSTSQAEGVKLGQFIGLDIARGLIKEGKWK